MVSDFLQKVEHVWIGEFFKSGIERDGTIGKFGNRFVCGEMTSDVNGLFLKLGELGNKLFPILAFLELFLDE